MSATLDHENIYLGWRDLRRAVPDLTTDAAARLLGTSEGELLASGCGREIARLQPAWPDVIREFPKLGRVLCQTRNDVITHERSGVFQSVEFYQDIGVVLGPEIDLRLSMDHWRHGFAVTEPSPVGDRKSFQFFDAHGTAVHKVSLLPDSDHTAYENLKGRFLHADQSPVLATLPSKPAEDLPDEAVDLAAFHHAWRSLEDTSYFADMLKSFGLRREQALRLAPRGCARRIRPEAVRMLLETTAGIQLPVMIFVRSPGCLQIHAGLIFHVGMSGPQRLSILDSTFDLHMNLSKVASAWVVRKPTLDGTITSVELFDGLGENIALFFGKRGYGQPERPQWRHLLRQLK